MQSSSSIENTLTSIKNNTAKVNAENAKNNVGSTELDQNAFFAAFDGTAAESGSDESY